MRCGPALAARVTAADLYLSVGLHTSEIARRGTAISGEGVTVAPAATEQAPAGGVWGASTLHVELEAAR